MKFKTAILILLILLIGCSEERKEVIPPENQPETTTIKLTPVDLFQGDAAKFQMFLGPMSGAFKLKYEGPKPDANLNIDIWKNGQKVDSAGSIGDLFFNSGKENASNEVEVIISVETVSFEGQNKFCTIKVSEVHQSGSSLATFTIPWDDKLTGRSLMEFSNPQSFTTNQPVHVFGMQATSSNGIYTLDPSPESLSKAEWALVFTLRFDI